MKIPSNNREMILSTLSSVSAISVCLLRSVILLSSSAAQCCHLLNASSSLQTNRDAQLRCTCAAAATLALQSSDIQTLFLKKSIFVYSIISLGKMEMPES